MKIIKAFLLLAIIFILSGCASLTFESKDGTKVTYTRFLTTATKIEAKVADAELNMNNQKIDTATLQALLSLLGGLK
jgi:uncharacterized protein YceK